jgi:hypothetical protein
MTNSLSFDDWKTCLRNDCQQNDKLREFHSFGESVLLILWRAGTTTISTRNH